MPKVTIRDVAREAQVSTTSVSHILRDTGSFSYRPETVARVQEVAQRLGYNSNPAARLLRQQQKTLIGLAVSVGAQPPLNHFAAAVYREIREQGYQAALCEREMLSPQDFEAPFPDVSLLAGLINAESAPPDFYLELQNRIPVISLTPSLSPNVEVVTTDRARQYEIAVEYLTRRGHRRIAHVGMDGSVSWVEQIRHEGRLHALRTFGADTDPSLQITVPPPIAFPAYTPDDVNNAGRAVADAFRHLKPAPTALMAWRDDVGFSALAHLQADGWRIPEQISLLCFEAVGCAAYAYPRITTVLPHFDEIASQAVARLLTLMGAYERGERPSALHQQIAPVLVERDSVLSIPRSDV